MSILCRVFGHKPPQYGGAPHYAKSPPASIWTDGSGRGHVNLYGDCYRCGKNFRIISFHPPKEWVERAAQGDGAEPVGHAGSMPGTAGFTMAAFRAADVPIGTPLYAHPPAPASVEADNDRFRIMLLDLLAVIHGDGGYKTQEIGVDMAHAQALQLSAERKAVPVEAEAMRAAADDDLARLIETRLLGIPADEQD